MYTYARLNEDLAYLKYNGFDVGSIGKSVAGNAIPFVHIGEYSGPQSIITGGIHARENVTSLLVMRQAFKAALSPRSFEGGIYFLPMLNPDGALLIEKGADAFPSRAEFLKKINGSDDFSLFKANINGVDLNNNFDARFGLGKGQRDRPSPQGFPGEYPFSEPETNALKKFTIMVSPKITISYHALGREIYYYFFQDQKRLERDKRIAMQFGQILGYKVVDSDMDSTGGYKDWCVQSLKIPALTIEIIPDTKSHPLSSLDLDNTEWSLNKDIPYLVAEIALQIKSI